MSGDFFTGNVKATDALGNILSQIFGNGWADIGLDAIFSAGSESASMIIAILGAWNIVILSFGSILLGWIAIQATVGTAHEGQFLGKRFHDYWVPLRSGLVITFLAPVAKGGLCVIQILGLIFIGFSIQFANHIQKAGLDYMLTHSGRVATVEVPPGMHENATKLAEGLLRTLVLQYHYKYNQKKDFDFYQIDKTADHCIFRFYGPSYRGQIAEIASVQIPDYSPSSNIALARANAVNNMYKSLQSLAYAIISNCTAEYDDVPIDHDLLKQSVDAYVGEVSKYVDELLSDDNPEFLETLEKFVAKSTSDGVLWLGSYYRTISQYAGKVHGQAGSYPAFREINLAKISDDINIHLEAALKTIQTLSDDLHEKIVMARENSGSWKGKKILNDITYGITSIGINGFVSSVVNGDPLANLSDFGHKLLWTAESVAFIYFGLYTTAEFADGTSKSWAGKAIGLFTAGTTEGATNAAAGLLSKLWSIVLFLLIPLITLGFFLAVYLPLVPWLIWMAAIVGCLIQWIEFEVFGPIWATTFATGEGEGLAGQRSQHGLMLIANTLLRLPLMTTGFMIAVVLMPLVGKVLGGSFMVAVGDVTADHVVGLPVMIGTWFIFGGFMILQSHVIFGLVTHLADNAMKFFGGVVSSMGEAAHEAKTRAMIMTSLGRGEGAGQLMLGKNGPDPNSLGGDQNANQQNSDGNQRIKRSGGFDLGERE